jgi:nucleoside-diphosphate-sugar epimerase
MNLLILGGAGFVGTNLARLCLEKGGYRLTLLDSLDERFHSNLDGLKDGWGQIRFIQADICDEAALRQAVTGQDIIINCAAQTSHPLSLREPFLDTQINCHGNLRVLEAVRQWNPQAVIVYVSSSTVVGRAVGDVIEESHWERPLDIYSANKGVAEKYYRIYNRVYDLKTVIIRLANLYGPFGKASADFGFINYFIHLAKTGKEITIYRPGLQTRNVLYVEDAAEALLLAAQEPKLIGDHYFAVHDEHLSVREIAYSIANVFEGGRVLEVDWPPLRKRIEVENVIISSAKLRTHLRWKPRFSFEEGLRKTKKIMEGSLNR